MIREFDGSSVRPSSPISIVPEQVGPSIHFLSWIWKYYNHFRGSGVKIYDKRFNVPPLASYRRFPISRKLSLLGVSTLSHTVNYAGFHTGVHGENISLKLRLD